MATITPIRLGSRFTTASLLRHRLPAVLYLNLSTMAPWNIKVALQIRVG
jgi:hypothetical protein